MYMFNFVYRILIILPATIIIIIKGYQLGQFPFGPDAGDNKLTPNDDKSTNEINVSFLFFGYRETSIYVNNNGDVSFGKAFSNYNALPFPLEGLYKIIAIFWTDIDTKQKGNVFYRISLDNDTLQNGTDLILFSFPNIKEFSASWMMVVTWEKVVAYGCPDATKITCDQNTFQLVLISDGTRSFAVFNYYEINWIKSTQVGFNAGDGKRYYSINGSMTESMMNLTQMSNIDIPGQIVFRVDQAEISNADIIDECASSPCIHGNCSNEYLQYVCICEPGYTGVNCEKDLEECASSPCLHGNCTDQVNGYICECTPGYTGDRCDTDVDECASSPCLHGNCTDRVNGYICECTPGYSGNRCDTDVDECARSPCLHGSCTDQVNGYICECIPGYSGDRCDKDVDECASSPCLHGNCTDQINGYICECTSGYTGDRCDTDVDECGSSPCLHGNCTDQVNGYICECTPGYSGNRCDTDLDECASSPCLHGNCTDQVNGYICDCTPGYTGDRCDTDVDECASSPCLHGNCTEQVNGYICECTLGYTGDRCDTEIDKCASSSCLHENEDIDPRLLWIIIIACGVACIVTVVVLYFYIKFCREK